MRTTGILALALAGACSSGGSGPEAPKAKPGPADLYTACWGHFNDRQWDAFGACFEDDATASQPGMPDANGRDAVVGTARAYAAAFSDMRGDLQLTLVNGDHIASLVWIHGTHDGELALGPQPIPATGKTIGWLIAHTIDIGPGGVASHQGTYADTPWLLAQLGLNPSPARPPMTAPWPETATVVATGSGTETANVAAH